VKPPLSNVSFDENRREFHVVDYEVKVLKTMLLILVLFSWNGYTADCFTNKITRDLCDSVEMFQECVLGKPACEKNSSLSESMVSTLFYLGRIDALASALSGAGQYEGDLRAAVEQLTQKYRKGSAFEVGSYDGNFIRMANKLNRKVREVMASLEDL